MLDYEHGKEYGLPMDESLRLMRIRRYPVQLGENMIVVDRLEASGTIRIYENTGGALNVPMDMDAYGMECNTNVVKVAEISVSVTSEEKRVELDRLYCEYGYNDELVPALLDQVMNFADFYNYRFSIDLRKKHKHQAQLAFSRGRAIAARML